MAAQNHEEVTRVLVTGASGFIATHTVQQLLQAGYKVRGTVRSLNNANKVKHLKDLCPNAAHELELVEADLLNEQCWASAVQGCSHVLHIASPFPIESPADENELIKPAVQGTTSVLQACADAGTVKRVVLTSSVVAIMDFASPKTRAHNEADWPNVSNLAPYNKSKTLAEKCAWEFMKSLPDDKKFELAVVNPGFVMGPVLSGSYCSAMTLVKKILTRDPPANVRINFGIVDVRDVAKAHINAMTEPEAVGRRHILVNKSMWMSDMAEILKAEFQQHGYNVSTSNLPKFIFKIVAIFDKEAKEMAPIWNKTFDFDNTRMRQVLKIEPTPIQDTFIDMGYSIIEGGYIQKHKNYKGRPAAKS
ncbi:uncharacterized protein [Amphiura filiformis]|uniref:uncharacterized protein n=1 Tax=Amphiura filiformis TaxID=82378 RepID=UPI003B22014F